MECMQSQPVSHGKLLGQRYFSQERPLPVLAGFVVWEGV